MLFDETGAVVNVVVAGKEPEDGSLDLMSCVTSEGLVFGNNYKMVYQIEGPNGLYKKNVEMVRSGWELQAGFSHSLQFFREFYEGPEREIVFRLRHFTKEICIIHSTLKIRGKGPKVIKSISNQSNYKYILKLLSKSRNRELVERFLCCYMMLSLDNIRANNTITIGHLEKYPFVRADFLIQ